MVGSSRSLVSDGSVLLRKSCPAYIAELYSPREQTAAMKGYRCTVSTALSHSCSCIDVLVMACAAHAVLHKLLGSTRSNHHWHLSVRHVCTRHLLAVLLCSSQAVPDA